MSLTEDRRNKVKKYILEEMFIKSNDIASKTAEYFGISEQTVYRYIRELIAEGKVNKIRNGNYEMIQTVNKLYKYDLTGKRLEEDVIYEETLSKYIKNLSDNIIKIWQYAFTEMVNNVLDHSEAKELQVYIGQNALSTWVNVIDDGIGIFKKIADFYEYESLDDAIISLFKGKLTTDKENHSGEGIFFTSRVMDHFGALSSNKLFQQNNRYENLLDLENTVVPKRTSRFKDRKGTVVVMSIVNDADRTLKEVFDMYSSVDGGFTITNIPMKMICDSGYPVSRSQAKRLYFGFDKFEKVILDFNGVDEIGQGFAHELFSVFGKRHPEIELQCINTNEAIEKMIRRVKED